MTRYKLLVAAALIMTLACAYLYRAQDRQSGSSPRQARVTYLEGYLLQLGDKYDVYFTLETAWENGEPSNWMESYKLDGPPKLDGLQRDLERLRKAVPHFTYTFNQVNPKVVHVVDERLAHQEAYGLECVIGDIDYTGPLPGLLTALGGQKIKVSTNTLGVIGDMRPRDSSTEVHVAAQNTTVRDAITLFTPLEGRRRIIWDATTNLAPGGMSQIQFYGKK